MTAVQEFTEESRTGHRHGRDLPPEPVEASGCGGKPPAGRDGA